MMVPSFSPGHHSRAILVGLSLLSWVHSLPFNFGNGPTESDLTASELDFRDVPPALVLNTGGEKLLIPLPCQSPRCETLLLRLAELGKIPWYYVSAGLPDYEIPTSQLQQHRPFSKAPSGSFPLPSRNQNDDIPDEAPFDSYSTRTNFNRLLEQKRYGGGVRGH